MHRTYKPVFVDTYKSDDDQYAKDVAVDGLTLQFVPDPYYNKELIITALNQNGLALQHVKPRYITPEIIEIAINQNPASIQYVPPKYLTYKLIKRVIDHDGMLLRFIPKPLRTEEILLSAVSTYPEAILMCSNQYLSVCYLAVMKNPRMLKHVEDKYKTVEMFKDIVLFIGIEEFIPLEYKTEKLVKDLHEFYISKGYTKIGDIYVLIPTTCTNPPWYNIIDEHGVSKSVRRESIPDIPYQENKTPYFME